MMRIESRERVLVLPTVMKRILEGTK